MRGVSRHQSVAVHFLFGAVFIFVFVTGYRGIDFGGHWDEPVMMRSVRRVVETGRLLPHRYNYPSMIHHMVWLCLVPDVVAAVGKVDGEAREKFRQRLAGKVMELPFAIRARTMFLVVTLLSLLWTYLVVFKCRGNWWEALLAAALLGLSWEVAYHARWITPDGVLMQFGALYVLVWMVMLDSESRKTRWLWTSALVAGLACGTKYPGGILLVPSLSYAVYRGTGDNRPRGKRLRDGLGVLLVFGVTFVATTPGILIEPTKFAQGVLFEIRHYATGHLGHSVSPGIPHAISMLQYLVLSAFSKFWPIAIACFGFAGIGGFVVLKQDRRAAFVLVLVPCLYFVFMSAQRVMFVRNLQILFPFMAVLAARGMMFAGERLRSRPLKRAYVGVILSGLIVNLVWLAYASNTIRTWRTIDSKRRVLEYLRKNTGEVVFVSALVAKLIKDDESDGGLGKLTSKRAEATKFVIDTRDGFERRSWPANRFGRWEIVSGPYEVNFDYYPLWGSNWRIVAVDADVASKLGAIRGQIP